MSFTVFAQTHLGDGVYLLDENIDKTSSVVRVSINQEQQNRLLDKDYVCPDADCDDINELIYQKELRDILRTRIYSKFNDDFDYVFYILNIDNSTSISSLNFTGRMHPVRIDYKFADLIYPNGGIADFYEKWGSDDKLKGVFYLPRYNYIKDGPSLHEFAHQWGVSCVKELNGHWGVSNAGGQLGGFKYLKKLGNNQYQGSMHEDFSSTFGTGGYSKNVYPYSDIELYLMGFKSAQDLRNGNFVLDIYRNGGRAPSVSNGIFTADQKISYTIDDIMANFGGREREPTPTNSPKEFKVLTIVLSLRDSVGQTVFENRVNQVVSDINWFAGKETPKNSGGLYNFYWATQEIGSISVSGIKNSLQKNLDTSTPDPNPAPNGTTSIIKKSEKNKQFGIIFSENPAHGKVEISLKTPEKLKYADLTIYDMTGNAMYDRRGVSHTPAKIEWNLTNNAGRFVANGTYLVIVEARAQNGNIYRYSAKLGVKR